MAGALDFTKVTRYDAASLVKERLIIDEMDRRAFLELTAAFGNPSKDIKNILLSRTYPWAHGENEVLDEVEKGIRLYKELFGDDAAGNDTT